MGVDAGNSVGLVVVSGGDSADGDELGITSRLAEERG